MERYHIPTTARLSHAEQKAIERHREQRESLVHQLHQIRTERAQDASGLTEREHAAFILQCVRGPANHAPPTPRFGLVWSDQCGMIMGLPVVMRSPLVSVDDVIRAKRGRAV